ncbi:MAG: hypothetical protein FWD35_04190 [Oscillospiraceae bacterium]|nr:hypothetical protein [Oscillospiraceae bacterium]
MERNKCEHDFRNDKCIICGAVMQYEICNVTEQVSCNSCMGSGGDFNMSENSYNSYCTVCNGTGQESRQVTRRRGYIVYPESKD